MAPLAETPEPGVGRQRRTTINRFVRTAIYRLRAQVDVDDGEGRHGCAQNGHEEIGPGEGRHKTGTMSAHEREKNQNECRNSQGGRCQKRRKCQRRGMARTLVPSMIPGTRVRGEDSGHGRAWRVDVRTEKASGLWRDEERQANQVPREKLQQGSQRAILEGIFTNGAEQSRLSGGQEEKR